jgi:hypothetical protein
MVHSQVDVNLVGGFSQNKFFYAAKFSAMGRYVIASVAAHAK